MGITAKASALRSGAAVDGAPQAQLAGASPSVGHAVPHLSRSRGWYATFAVLALLVFFVVDHFTGLDFVAASARFVWNGVALAVNSVVRATGSMLLVLARGIGWRRLSRAARVVMGIGLGYAGGVVLSDRRLRRAQTWSGQLRALAAALRSRWLALPLLAKLAVVSVLIASQVYLHFLLILFPIAFLVPVVRRLWVRVADVAIGSWYWKTFGRRHRSIVRFLRSLPGVRHAIGWVRLTRIRYLCAWRLWRYDPRYLDPASGEHHVSFVEPVRLWWRGDLDIYVDSPLLCGPARAAARPRRSRQPDCASGRETRAAENR